MKKLRKLWGPDDVDGEDDDDDDADNDDDGEWGGSTGWKLEHRGGTWHQRHRLAKRKQGSAKSQY